MRNEPIRIPPPREEVARAISKCCANQSDWNLRLRMADAAIAALRRVSLSAPREDVYRAALEEIASGLSVRNPFDIANEALK